MASRKRPLADATSEHQHKKTFATFNQHDKQCSARRALGITEIVENILLYLPLQSLLLSQRVSKSIKTVIDNSSPIQQALFLKPIEPKPTAGINYGGNVKSVSATKRACANPLICRFIKGIDAESRLHRNLFLVQFNKIQNFRASNEPDRNSWKRMLVVQPQTLPQAFTIDNCIAYSEEEWHEENKRYKNQQLRWPFKAIRTRRVECLRERCTLGTVTEIIECGMQWSNSSLTDLTLEYPGMSLVESSSEKELCGWDILALSSCIKICGSKVDSTRSRGQMRVNGLRWGVDDRGDT